MRRVAKSMLYTIVVLCFLVWMMPKVNLYYQLEGFLKTQEIIVDGEDLSDKGLWLDLAEPTLYLKQVELAKAQKGKILVLGLYNQLCFKDIMLDKTFENMLPVHIKKINLRYWIFQPLTLFVKVEGDFGVADLEVKWYDQNLSLRVEPSKIMQTKYKSTLQKLKHQAEGGYTYATSF